MAFASSRSARTNSFTAVGTSPSVGGGLNGPLRGLPPGIDCAGKAGARKRCLAPIIARWPSLPRGAPAPTPSLPSARRPQSEGASTAPSEASPQESTAPAKPALESAVWLPSSLDGLRFLAERPHQLLHCRRHVALSRRGPQRPPPRPPPRNRLRRQSRRSKALFGSRIIAKWPSPPRATPAPTPSLRSARRPQSEGAATAPSEASPQESTAPAKPALH